MHTTKFIIVLTLLSILLLSCKEDSTPSEPIQPPGPIQPTENQSICEDECEAPSCENYEYIDCIPDENNCKKTENKGIILGKCKVECLSNLNCKTGQVCADHHKCITLPDKTQSLDNLFKQKKQEMENQRLIDDKLERCAKLCADDRYYILAVKDRCNNDCFQVYYNKGDAGLDEYMINLSQNP